MKIALYKSVGCGLISANEILNWIEKDPDYIRVSEIVDVEFKDLDKESLVNEEIKSLRVMQDNLRAETQTKVEAIEQRIQELLALPNLKESDDGENS